MSWLYRMRWLLKRGVWHIDDCTLDEFFTVCGVEYTPDDHKASTKPDRVCKTCERLVVAQLLRNGPPIHESDDPRLGGDPR